MKKTSKVFFLQHSLLISEPKAPRTQEAMVESVHLLGLILDVNSEKQEAALVGV